MSILNRLLGRTEKRAMTLADVPWADMVPTTIAGINVNGSEALKSPTALAAIRAISETAGGLPMHVFSRTAGHGRERDRDHSANTVLSTRANPWTSAADLRVKLLQDALCHGRGVAVAIRSGGKVKELHRVAPSAVTVEMIGGEPMYLIAQDGGQRRSYHYRDVVDLLTPGSTVDKPLCLVREGRECIALDIAMSQYFSRLIGKGARPGAILSSEEKISPKAFDEFLGFVRKQLERKSGETLILPAPFKFNQQTFSSVDMQFGEMLAATRNEILKLFRVPPTLAGDYSRAVWRNLEESMASFLSMGILPWCEALEFAFTRVLIDEDNTFLEPQTADLIRPNTLQLYQAARTATGGAVLTANEARSAFFNLPAIEGGDELIRQAGQTAADDTPPAKEEPADA